MSLGYEVREAYLPLDPRGHQVGEFEFKTSASPIIEMFHSQLRKHIEANIRMYITWTTQMY